MPVSNPGINLILGPVILGVIINMFLFGIVFMQAVTYYTSSRYKRDSWAIKGLVSWVLLLDTFHSCAVIWVVWEYCINHFGDLVFLGTTPWAYPTTPIFSACASVPIQIFLAWRVKLLSQSWPIFGVLSTLSVASGIMAFISAIRAVQASNIKEFATLIPVVDSWLALSVVCDLSLTLLLFLYLRRSRTGFAKTDNIITRLTFQSIETASFSAGHVFLRRHLTSQPFLGTLNSVLDLITFTSLQNTNFHFVFALVAGRLYNNTLLTTLNSRDKMSEDMDGINTTTSFLRGAAVHISVERHQTSGMELNNYSARKMHATGLDGSGSGSVSGDHDDTKR
ncbi:hypothetical protein B0H17DRAFT_1106661 [Mycena rosella]|uniref:DUF6534 domain-containing protein n=1 Tax=Mycena rosella TaxID=1033263 RepID=A0AAD7C2Y6_MYCRO|nr:hypothetical protein B0H17DRAFT_1106661 [Mycena rosella]